MAFKDYIKGKELVGKKTNLKTTYKGKPVNRPVYINKDGEISIEPRKSDILN